MKRLFIALLLAALAGGAFVFAGRHEQGGAVAQSGYRTVLPDRGTIIAQVSTTGTVAPTTTVIVGSQLSGQVVEILADFNSEVKTNQVLARLNSDQIRARLDAARADHQQARANRAVQDAQMEKAKADLARAQAAAADMQAQVDKSATQLADADRTLDRQTELESRGIASQVALQAARTQRDTLRAQRNSALAQLDSARAQGTSLAADLKVIEAQMLTSEAIIAQRAAMVRQIEVDLANTEIRSPVDGVVIQRNVELGQPVAASLQAPTLFLVAQDLRRIEIQGNVDEADVGRVREGQEATFTVNAFPGRTFTGRVKQVRLGSQTVQNVVIYTAVITVENPNLELRPGMTANLRIITERRDNVLRIANAALRWRPPAQADVADAPPRFAPGDGSAAGPFGGPPEGGPGGGLGGGGRGGGNPGAILAGFAERLRADLNLTPDQSRDLDKLVEDIRQASRRDGPPGPEDRRQRGREVREMFIERGNAFLTPEQRVKFRDMRADMRPGRGDRPGDPNAGIPGRIYRLGADGQPMSTPVRLGANDGAFTEVLAGLEPGAPVIVGGAPAGRGRSGLSALRFGF